MSKILNREFKTLKKEYYNQLEELTPITGLKNVESYKQKVYYAFDVVERDVLDNNKTLFKVEYGNKKLPKTTLIASTGSWFNCIGRKTGMCEICDFCYARSPEIMFKNILASRIKKELIFRAFDSHKIASDIISQARKNTLAIRFNEVGEMRDNNDLKKVINISQEVYKALGIKSYIYTHNRELNFSIPHSSLVINTSNFKKEGANNEYMVLDDETKAPKGAKRCICDCKRCNLCLSNTGVLYEVLRR